MFDFFCNFFPDCSFYYRKFFFIDKLCGMDILDEREYFFLFSDSLEIPYLKLARYFDFYLGNIFAPSVPAYEKNVREPGYSFVYDIEDFLYFLKENEDKEKLHEFNILYNNKKISYFNSFCRDLYKHFHYSNQFELLNNFHMDLVKKKNEEEIFEIKKIKEKYVSFVKYFYYPFINDKIYYVYDYTLGTWMTPFIWSWELFFLKIMKYIYRYGHFHKNHHRGKTFTDIVEESGYRNVLSRPMRPKPVVTWREFSWVEPEYNKLKTSIYKGKIEQFHVEKNDINKKYDFDENPILKKKLMKDHHIIENNIVLQY